MEQSKLKMFLETYSSADLSVDTTFREMITEALASLSMTDELASRLLSVSRPTVTRWKNGRYAPHPLVRGGVRDLLLEKARMERKKELQRIRRTSKKRAREPLSA